ncbi:peptidoglycan DD-transpeptidase FtsI [Candidatus Nitrotoga sp. BS]|uniref:peptidoglycan D,D-transpeptidase FtsI family protein n=1 Tax=Candidatus Nitrotoga sp. BS TaxID=2890408 RepID=UPI001EF36BCA|nr:penicillin-binding protein 2 [Candidatus Nitrotoga sp. BS]CAH1207226.1 peptidoglycan DD-transpeptidase FtsI [Candidatus Nitrotoga sp. BS]
MNYSSHIQAAKLATLPQWRSQLLFVLLLIGMATMIVRAVYLQSIHHDFLQQKGDARSSRVIEISAHRGMIADRNGEPLAISTPVESISVSSQDLDATKQQVNQLARILGMDINEVQHRLFDTTRNNVYLKRQLPPEQVEKIVKLGIPGVSLRREYRRYYPGGDVTAHLLGFTDVDDNGQEGLELALQNQLSGKAGSQRVIKDLRGHIVEDVTSIRAPKPGSNLMLSIDSKIQYLAYREIKQAVKQHRAQAGSIVVLDAQSGEVLALANWPSFNPNNRAKPNLQVLRNRVVTDQFEPGSTLKPFTVAAALDIGKVTPQTIINTENGVMQVGRHKINDTHQEEVLTVAQVIQKSSNVGAAKIALSLAPETIWQSLNDSGFGTQGGSGFPGEATGKLRDFQKWRPIEQATLSYGHGISVSLLQLARAYTIFANNGELKPVSWLKLDAPVEGKKVYSATTAREILGMLELAVLPGGTAPLAQINGYRVAGKTGTAHKLEGGHYVNRYISSFVGLAPATNPRLVVAVMINEPNNGQYYGGLVAAPVFSNVMGAALRLLNVPNDTQLGNVLMPQSVDFVKEEV